MHKGWGWSCKRLTELSQISYGMLRTGLRMKRSHQGLVLWLFFNPQTLSMSVHNRSVADPVRSINVFNGYFCHRSIKDVGDATRTSRMGIQTIRTVTKELRMRHRRPTYINYRYDPQSLYGKIKQFDFSVASPQTHGICSGSHKDITDDHMGGKDYP